MKGQKARGKKLIYFLKRMEPKELNRFREWLNSPEGGNSPKSVRLFDFILDSPLKRDRETIELPPLITLLGIDENNKTQIEKAVSVQLSLFQKKLFQFLSLQGQCVGKAQNKSNLAMAFIQMNGDKYLGKAYQDAVKECDQSISGESLLTRTRLEMAMNSFRVSQGGPPGVNHLEEVHHSLDYYFIIQKLKYGCATLIENNGLPTSFEGGFIPLILEMITLNLAHYPDVIRAYFHAFCMLKEVLAQEDAAEESYKAFVEAFRKPVFTNIPEGKDLFAYGQNFCILKIRQGDNSYRERIASLYQFVLELGHFEENNKLSPFFYKNSVEVLCKLKKFDKALELASQFKSKIGKEFRESAFSYNQAVIMIHQGNYRNGASQLYQLLGNLNSIYYNLGARVYYCRSLWKLQEYEELGHALHAFTQYVYRYKDQLPMQYQRYRRFIGFLNRMALAMQNTPEKGLSQMKKIMADIEEKEEASLFGWLREEINTYTGAFP